MSQELINPILANIFFKLCQQCLNQKKNKINKSEDNYELSNNYNL